MPNHPTDAEWVAYMYGGELERAERRQLAAHLAQCEECLTKVGTWRVTLDTLDASALGGHVRRPRRGLVLWTASAAAAMVLVALGYAAARMTAPEPVDVPALKAEVAASVSASLEPRLRQELMSELRGDWVPALGATRDLLYETLYEQLGRDVRDVAERAAITSTAETSRKLGQYLRGLLEAQEQDSDMVIQLMRAIEASRRDDAARMRQELGTLAVLTSEEFGRTHAKIDRLVAYGQQTP